jgi:AraC family transcriptional activator of pobA
MDFLMSELTVDRLPDPATALQVVLLDRATFGEAAGGAREPHRHDYHELIWAREGSGEHLIDGRPIAMPEGTITLIGRGQVHVLRRASGLTGGVVRFREEMLLEGGRANPAWLLGARGERIVDVPESEAGRVQGVIEALAAETRRPVDARSADVQRHLLSTLLLWIERFYDAARTQTREVDDADVELYRRFALLLDRDFARHHDARHYADALAVPQAALSRALTEVTGRATKEHVTDRVMVEAARLLAFTDLSVGEIAYRVGFDDPLYFSRAFKRHHREPPQAYRVSRRGT